jgi:hypothetical protein
MITSEKKIAGLTCFAESNRIYRRCCSGPALQLLKSEALQPEFLSITSATLQPAEFAMPQWRFAKVASKGSAEIFTMSEHD